MAGAMIPAPALACRLALLLALDISSSVDQDEDRLQRDGLAGALVSPEVQAAFLSMPGAPVALGVFEWSGQYNQVMVLDWRMIRAPGDLAMAARTVRGSTRSFREFPTAIGQALVYASGVFADAPPCDRRTLDISGDGENNESFPPINAYENFPLDGVTVNALAIGGSKGLDYIEAYYRREVIRGPGAFVEIADDYADFRRAMERKLEREVSSQVVGGLGVMR